MYIYGACSHIGQFRKENQDSWFADPYTGYFLVADGMGGHAGGMEASRIAAAAIENHYPERLSLERESGKASDIGALVEHAIQKANEEVFQTSQITPSLKGMGTTLTVLTFSEGDYHIGQVGDSRAYRIRDGEMEQLTTDHNVVAQLVQSGALSPEKARTHPHRNIVTRSVGTDRLVKVDLFTGKVFPQDMFLLCSDGLTGELMDSEILSCVLDHEPDPEEACIQLVDEANRAGGRDNITVVLVRTG